MEIVIGWIKDGLILIASSWAQLCASSTVAPQPNQWMKNRLTHLLVFKPTQTYNSRLMKQLHINNETASPLNQSTQSSWHEKWKRTRKVKLTTITSPDKEELETQLSGLLWAFFLYPTCKRGLSKMNIINLWSSRKQTFNHHNTMYTKFLLDREDTRHEPPTQPIAHFQT